MDGAQTCAKCGNVLKPGARFCTKCGTVMGQAVPPPVPQAYMQQAQPAAQPHQPPPPPAAQGRNMPHPPQHAAHKAAAAPEKPRGKVRGSFAPRIQKDFWQPDAFVPEGKAAPTGARLGAFAFDLFLFSLFTFAVFWFTVLNPYFDEILAYVSTGGEIQLTSLLSRMNILIVCCIFYMVFYTLIPVAVKGQSLGKFLAGIKIITKKGDPLNLAKTLLRSLAYIISGLPLFLGFFWALKDKNHEAFHDKIAGTRVIHVKNSGTIKRLFLYAAPILLVITFAGSWMLIRGYIGGIDFKPPFDYQSSTPQEAAELFCESNTNFFKRFYLLPPELRKGTNGWASFSAFYGNSEFLKSAQKRNAAGSNCRVLHTRQVDKSHVWITFGYDDVQNGKTIERRAPEQFILNKEEWYWNSDEMASILQNGIERNIRQMIIAR